ncbi:MAG: septal ring lytic transglycosylase RlpA family protein [Nitrospinota bacterium]
MKNFRIVVLAIVALLINSCASVDDIKKHVGVSYPDKSTRAATSKPVAGIAKRSQKPYSIDNITYYPLADGSSYDKKGIASWYGKKFHGKLTASGEKYDMYAISAAHKTLPLGTTVEVTNLDNGKKLQVRINDRGPFVDDRIIDLSQGAAAKLDILEKGTAPVRVVAVGGGSSTPSKPPDSNKGGWLDIVPDFSLKGIKIYPETEPDKNIYIQLAAFSSYSAAKNFADSFDHDDDPLLLEKALSSFNRGLTRVRIGPYSSIDDATKTLSKYRELGHQEAFLVVD